MCGAGESAKFLKVRPSMEHDATQPNLSEGSHRVEGVAPQPRAGLPVELRHPVRLLRRLLQPLEGADAGFVEPEGWVVGRGLRQAAVRAAGGSHVCVAFVCEEVEVL
jgi:hypothetical protein